MDLFSEESDRYSKRINYALYPWLSLPLFVAAGVLSAVYQPPSVACMIIAASSLLAGVCLAYGPVSRVRWIEYLSWGIGVFPATAVIRIYSIDLDGMFFSLLLWIGVGLTAPFWIWRRRGLELYRSPASSDAIPPDEKTA